MAKRSGFNHTITLHFKNEEVADHFWGWFLDGGGEQDFMQSWDDHNDNDTGITTDWEERDVFVEEYTRD